MDISSYLILGAIVTIIMELIKKYSGTNGLLNTSLAIIVSLIAGSIYVLIYNTGYWTTVVQVLGSASAFYAVIVRSIPKPPNQ